VKGIYHCTCTYS